MPIQNGADVYVSSKKLFPAPLKVDRFLYHRAEYRVMERMTQFPATREVNRCLYKCYLFMLQTGK